MKPCPSCGTKPLPPENYAQVVCHKCGCAGPVGTRKAGSVELWDALPRREDAEALRALVREAREEMVWHDSNHWVRRADAALNREGG